MPENLQHIDENATLAINSWNSPIGDQFWYFMSNSKVWIPFYAMILIMLFVKIGWKKSIIVIISIVLAFSACDQTANLIKHLAERLRPCYNHYMVDGGLHILEGRGGRFGFFSAHAANAFSLAVTTILGLKNGGAKKYKGAAIFLIIWAILVSVSRIFVGKHFLGDVMVGTIIGIGYGFLFGSIAKWFITHTPEKA